MRADRRRSHLSLQRRTIGLLTIGLGIGSAAAFAGLHVAGALQPKPATFEVTQLVSQLDDTECRPSDTYTNLDEALRHADSACALTLSFQDISVMPETVGSLRNLKEFRARGTQITSYPATFWRLSALKLLDVMDSDFTTVPPDIQYLTHLEKLEIGGTHITTLPDELNELRNLTFFDIMDTPVKKLPARLDQLTHLRDVDIDETAITDISPLVGLPIVRLIADYDQGLDIAPVTKLTQLRELSLSGCSIAMLPTDLWKLSNLVKLNVSNNSITNLPATMPPMPHVKQVNFAKNSLVQSADAKRLFPNATLIGLVQK